MKQVRLTSLNKMSWMLSKEYFNEEDFELDEDNRLVLVGEVEEDYLSLLEEYKQFEEKNRKFLKCFKQLKLIKRELLEKNKEQEQIEE